MRSDLRIVILLFASILFVGYGCQTDDDSLDVSMTYEEVDVSYGNDPLQTYDVYLPANRSESTTNPIVLIHGGGWVSGDKEDVAGIVDLLKQVMPGYAIINMNYRLTTQPNNPFIDQLADVANVVAEVDIMSDYYDISDDMILIGVSAGGHMAMQYSYSNNVGDKVKIVGNIIGPTYFLDPEYTMPTDPFLALLSQEIVGITGVPYTDVSFYEAISPFNAVSSSSPPTIQFHGSEDPLVPPNQGPLLKAALDDNGVPNELIIYEGEGHGWSDPANWTDTANRFRDFVSAHFQN